MNNITNNQIQKGGIIHTLHTSPTSPELQNLLNNIMGKSKQTKRESYISEYNTHSKHLGKSKLIQKQQQNTNKNKNTSTNKKSSSYINTIVKEYYNNDNVKKNYLNTLENKNHIFPQQKRVIVIGDIHGDFNVAINCLVLSKCIEDIEIPENKSVSEMNKFFSKLKWIGGNTYVVQLGDQIDRVRPQKWDSNDVTRDLAHKDEGSTLEIFYLFYYLDKLARMEGSNGRVLSIIGNHEIMNIEGDFRYVSLQEFKSFKAHLSNVYHRQSKFPYNTKTLKKNSYKLSKKSNMYMNKQSNKSTIHTSNKYDNLPEGYRERLLSFSPTGICSNLIGSNSYTILQIGNWLFCHGSPVLNTLKNYPVDMINNIVSMFLLGIDTDNEYIDKHYKTITSSGEESILWNRDFGETELTDDNEEILLQNLNIILKAYNKKNSALQTTLKTKPVTHIAIGHTIQDTNKNGINSICNDRAWRCDVAMSNAFGDNKKTSKFRRPQVLEIIDGIHCKVLY
jgi:hypothetical protein